MNEEEQYFMQQAGTGIAIHQGYRHQKGYSFWGRILKWIQPVIRFLGKQAISTGADIAQDVLIDDKDLKESVKERAKEAGKNVVRKGIMKLRGQKGSGRKASGKKRKYKSKTKRKTKKLTSRTKAGKHKKRKISDLLFT